MDATSVTWGGTPLHVLDHEERLRGCCHSLWHVMDAKPRALLKIPIRELVKAGPNAPLVLVRHVIESEAPRLVDEAEGHRSADNFDIEEYVDQLIKRQLMLVRGQGALAGLSLVAAEAAASAEVVGSAGLAAPVAVGGTALVILGDVATLSYFQIELSLKIATAFGHDLGDHQTRAREIIHLHGLEMIGGDNLGPVVGRGGERVLKRILMRYLKGDALKAAKAMFRFVGIKFTRVGLLKLVPFVNVPIGVAIAEVTTRRSATKARKFYALLAPAAERSG